MSYNHLEVTLNNDNNQRESRYSFHRTPDAFEIEKEFPFLYGIISHLKIKNQTEDTLFFPEVDFDHYFVFDYDIILSELFDRKEEIERNYFNR